MLSLSLKIALIAIGIVAALLGAHGIYTYAQWSNLGGNPFSAAIIMALMGADSKEYFSRLFLSVDVPSQFQGWVFWASTRGLESWIVPAALVGAGLFAWSLAAQVWVPSRLWNISIGRHGDYRQTRHGIRNRPRDVILKTALCVTAIAAFVFLVWSAYFVFQRKEHPLWGASAIAGAMAILGIMLVLLLNWRILLSYPYRFISPGFRLVLAVVVVVSLVFAFAGVEPLSSYKDDAVSSIKNVFTSESGTTSQPIATKQIGSWLYTLHGVKRGSTSIEVDITITNKGTQPLVWDSSSVNISHPDFVCVDSYDQCFPPENNSWYWMKKMYPGEVVRGKAKYQVHQMSDETRLYLGSNYPLIGCTARWLLFDLR